MKVISSPTMANVQNLGCTVTQAEGCLLEDKQHVNIVIVPETIFLAFRESAAKGSDKDFAYMASPEDGTVATQLDSIYVNEPGSTVTDVGVVPLSQDEDASVHEQRVKIQPVPFAETDPFANYSTNGNEVSQRPVLPDKNSAVKIATTQSGVESVPATANNSAQLESVIASSSNSLTHIAPRNGGAVKPNVPANTPCTIMVSTIGTVVEDRRWPSGSDEETDFRYKCTVFNCGKTFDSLAELDKHEKGHHNVKMYRCSYQGCPWSFETRYKLTRHVRSHDQNKEFKCKFPGCTVECSTEYNLKKHTELHANKRLTCERCGMNFPNQHKKQKHLRQVHRVAPCFKCPHEDCDKVLSTGSALIHHIKAHKNPTSRFVCTFEDCGKKFHRPSTYRDHILCQHTNVRPYKCDFPGCEKAFSSGIKLRRHQVVHNPVGRLSCPYENCESTFHRTEHLRLHLKTHSKDRGERSVLDPVKSNEDSLIYYYCPYKECGSLFLTLSGARQHIRRLHRSGAKAKVAKQSESSVEAESEDTQPSLLLEKAGAESAAQADGSEKISIIVSADPPDTEVSKNNHGEDTCSPPPLVIADETSQPGRARDVRGNVDEQSSQSCFQAFGQDVNFGQQETTEPFTSGASPNGPALDTLPDYELSSPLRARLDPAQFLLDATVDFVPKSSTVSQSVVGGDSLQYVTISPSSAYNAARAADRFLNFSECVQTVNPNMVMSEPRSRSVDNVECSSGTTHDIDGDGSIDENEAANPGGSARTDCDAYRRVSLGKKARKFSKVSLFASSGCGIGPTFNNIAHGLYLTQDPENDPCSLHRVSQFLRDPDQERQGSDDGFKNSDVVNLPEEDFSRSTINLSDLA